MQNSHPRATALHFPAHADEFAVVAARALQTGLDGAETLVMFLGVGLLWSLIVYLALQAV